MRLVYVPTQAGWNFADFMAQTDFPDYPFASYFWVVADPEGQMPEGLRVPAVRLIAGRFFAFIMFSVV